MRRIRAFTLLELMIVMAVVAVLALLAMSTWSSYWERMRRATAGAALVAVLAQMELRHARMGTFWPQSLDAPMPLPMPRIDGYNIYPPTSCGNAPNDNRCVEVIASPTRPDPLCGSLTLRSTGERSPPIPACWP